MAARTDPVVWRGPSPAGLLVLALLIGACSGLQLRFDRARAQTISKGMSRDQVRAILGQPMYVVMDLPNPQHTIESWRYVDNSSLPEQALELHFDDSALVEINGP
jgi:hypothetical protein